MKIAHVLAIASVFCAHQASAQTLLDQFNYQQQLQRQQDSARQNFERQQELLNQCTGCYRQQQDAPLYVPHYQPPPNPNARAIADNILRIWAEQDRQIQLQLGQ